MESGRLLHQNEELQKRAVVQRAEPAGIGQYHSAGGGMLEGERRKGRLALVNAMHITASVFINDDEKGLLHDYEQFLEKLAPHEPTGNYRPQSDRACREAPHENSLPAYTAASAHRRSGSSTNTGNSKL